MAGAQWARLKADLQCALRRGAWYKVLKLGPREAVVEVKGREVAVPRTALEVVAQPPRHWTVVPRPRHAPRLPSSWGQRYAVCPNCRARAPLEGEPQSMRCPRCNGLFEVAWGESYLAGA